MASPQSHTIIARLIPMLTRRMGGPLGRHSLVASGAWAYLLATFSWLICMLRQIPCTQRFPNDSPARFVYMCYTDISALYFSRGQGTGGIPYVDVQWEYPVLTGYFASLASWLSQICGAVFRNDIDQYQLLTNENIYFAISAVGLFLCLLWLISSTLRIMPNSPGFAMVLALSPNLMTTGLINWDLLAVALTAAGLAAWLESRPVWAGVWWGLGVAAKLYPIVIIGALFILCIRPEARRNLSKLASWLLMLGVAGVAWLATNLPVMLTHPEGWKYFYTMNADRGADWGSFWLALSFAGVEYDSWAMLSRIVMVVGYLLLAVLIYFAKRTPSVQQIAYLAVIIMIVGNLVYSPQYVLWVLPLVILIRPYLLDLTVFTVSELIYFVFVWLQIGEVDLSLGFGFRPWAYILSIFIRIGATVWIIYRVVQDVLAPSKDTPDRYFAATNPNPDEGVRDPIFKGEPLFAEDVHRFDLAEDPTDSDFAARELNPDEEAQDTAEATVANFEEATDPYFAEDVPEPDSAYLAASIHTVPDEIDSEELFAPNEPKPTVQRPASLARRLSAISDRTNQLNHNTDDE